MNPKWLTIGLTQLGTTEGAGAINNPAVTKYYTATGLGASPDSVPWCGAFEAWCMKEAGIPYRMATAARALDWLNWGKSVKYLKDKIPPGAIGVIRRGTINAGTGHVFQFMGWLDESHATAQVLEGNANTVRNANTGAPIGKSDGIVQIGTVAAGTVLDWRWPDGVPIPNEVKPLTKSTTVQAGIGIGVTAVGAVGANSTEIIEAVQKAKSISNGSIIYTILGVVIVAAVIFMIIMRNKQKANDALIQDNPGDKADKPANSNT